eukprot:CAMPEP_0202726214 /NCGR_PEP_ID=MMETSP1385-20130828/184498_1 /ASSEMBLY_ACC=CAM_ASM_000861 /TAXON_ID=933848 /ORGANISM="Elphidium margaritaceum" /LENGTH=572 /DNA_ID=CAMNT_0049392429 /DNA_START=136 /DNA_END=1854 /DNA_ORIENTATION=-
MNAMKSLYVLRSHINIVYMATMQSQQRRNLFNEHRNDKSHKGNNRSSSSSSASSSMNILFGLSLLGAGAAIATSSSSSSKALMEGLPESPSWRAGQRKDELRDYRLDEVAQHTDPTSSFWVIYREGVYDVTQFIEDHPGGEKLLLAAGSRIDPFWGFYINHNAQHVHERLEGYRIGNLHPDDVAPESDADENDPYANDPRSERSPMLLVRSEKPFCAEPPEQLLLENWLLPTELHYIRNHLPVPDVAYEDWTLTIEIEGDDTRPPLTFTIDELKENFDRVEIESTLMCIGNRVQAAKETKHVGTFYGTAIGNSRWAGVRVRDLLRAVGVSEEEADNGHFRFVHTEAYDKDPISDECYGGCVPFEKCWSSVGDALVAYEMNGAPMPRDHGAHLRLIAPGYAGVRNTKWLKKLVVSPNDGTSTWYTSDMKGAKQRIMEWTVNSYITEPLPGRVVIADEECIDVSGYAYAGGGRGIARVDVSVDNGKTWIRAQLKRPDQPLYRTWSWTHWTAEIELPEQHPGGELQICVRAIDVSFNTQPSEVIDEALIEFGAVNNAWHHVPVVLEPRELEESED